MALHLDGQKGKKQKAPFKWNLCYYFRFAVVAFVSHHKINTYRDIFYFIIIIFGEAWDGNAIVTRKFLNVLNIL